MSAQPAIPSDSRHDIAALLAAIGDVPVQRDVQVVRRRSRDYFWYSPVLNRQLHGKAADLICLPRNEQDVVAVTGACARLRIPLTVRAASTVAAIHLHLGRRRLHKASLLLMPEKAAQKIAPEGIRRRFW